MKHHDLEDLLREALRDEVTLAAPRLDSFEERVLKQLGERVPRRGFMAQLRQLIAPTPGGRVVQLAIVASTAAAFLVLGLFLADRGVPLVETTRSPSLAAAAATADVLFVVPAPTAKSVAVVGDFSNWEAVPLTDDNNDGIWTAAIPLPPGRYEYAFLIDGLWRGQDLLADEQVENFGQFTSVRYVSGGDGA
jgi:hypothetical protein